MPSTSRPSRALALRRLLRAVTSWRPGVGRAALAGLDLEPGEHVIAHARTTEGAAAVATDRALYVPTPAGSRRIAWERVARASWERGVLRVSEAGTPGESPPVHLLGLPAPGLLPDAVHDRVTSTLVVNEHVPLHGASGVRIIARRRGGGTELVWSMAFDSGLDPTDPDVRAAATDAYDALRRQLGA